MRTFVVGDIHGGLKALQQLIDRIGLKAEDKLIFLGDYVDGWSESAQVIQFLMALSKTHDCVFIKGNHDAWCEDWLRAGQSPGVWLAHGGKETVESYRDFTDEGKREHQRFFEQMSMFHLDAENRLFIHAGFTTTEHISKEFPKENLFRDRTLWFSALEEEKYKGSNPDTYPLRFKLYKEIYIGHTPTIRVDSEEPVNVLNLWNVDTGAAFTGKLSAVNIDTKEVIQSDVVMDLYPNEQGRNTSPYRIIKRK